MGSGTTKKSIVKIGGASGYWGDSAMSTPQLLSAGDLDYIVYDYLAEITMSIMARERIKDANAGYAKDFIDAVLQPNLAEIARQGVKIISNAGGVNPEACGRAARDAIARAGLSLNVAVISGDDLLDQRKDIALKAPREIYSNADFPEPEKITSINAYLGAFPIAAALEHGADIVIAGRCVDSAVTLGALIHEYGWTEDDLDLLASGSLAGHIIECGPQATGGNFTDWEDAGDIANIGYPIAEIANDGSFDITKPAGTGGIVNVGTVSEQLVYEIGDPQAYILPDVICDFSDVTISEQSPNKVHVSQAKGCPPPQSYKCCLTFKDGFRGGITLPLYGIDAEKKANKLADAAFERARKTLHKFNAPDFTETSIEIVGSESQYGDHKEIKNAREVFVKIAAKHHDALGIGVLLKETAGLGLATPPGLSGFSFGRAKPTPVVRLFSFEYAKEDISISINLEGDKKLTLPPQSHQDTRSRALKRPIPPTPPEGPTEKIVPLIKLAWGRSGDKGNKANIGIIARRPEFYPFIWNALTETVVADRLVHFIDGAAKEMVQRFALPGSNAINFLVDNVLGGGGVASLRIDPQGKGYAQLILEMPIPVTQKIIESLS